MKNLADADSGYYDAPFQFPVIKPPVFPDRMISVADAGAMEGGSVKCTKEIQRTIDSCSALGGGTVLIPKGIWLTGALKFRSNINLRLAKDAELRFSQDKADYLPVVFSRHEDIECYKYSAFLYANGEKNIAITGEGKLNGQGKPWWDWKQSKKDVEALLYKMGSTGVPVKERIFDGHDGLELRPAFFQPMNCENILVEGVTFEYGAFWTITPTYCTNIIVRNVHIVTEGEYGHTPNGDGVDPSSCRNVLIENCDFDTGDDCVAIKSGRDADGLRVNKPTENIIVRNCRGYRGHGGVVIGSESSGGVRNVYGTHCNFTGTDRMVRIKTARGRGGVIENLWFDEITGDGIRNEAIHVNMLYTGKRLPSQPLNETTPAVRNLNFRNIRCTSGESYGVEILGLPERTVDNCRFEGIETSAKKGVNLSDVKGITFTGCTITTPSEVPVTITDGRDVRFDSVRIPGNAVTKIRVEGKNSGDILFRRCEFTKDGKSVLLTPEVAADAVHTQD